MIQALSGEKGATAEVLLAREALDELLTSLIERKLTVSEAVSLIQLYSRGIEGVCKPDAAKLLTIIKKVYETFKEVDDLKEICAQTKLLDQLTGTPSAVQYFVLSIKCALIEYELEKKAREKKTSECMSDKDGAMMLRTLERLEEVYGKKESDLLVSSGALHKCAVRAAESEDMLLATFLTSCILERLMHVQSITEKEVALFKEGVVVSDMLERRIYRSEEQPFLKCSGKLNTYCVRVKKLLEQILQKEVSESNKSAKDMSAFRHMYALLCFLINTDFTFTSLKDGMALLAKESDSDLVDTFLNNGQSYVKAYEKQQKLAIHWTLLQLALLAGKGNSALTQMRMIIEWGRATKSSHYLTFFEKQNMQEFAQRFVPDTPGELFDGRVFSALYLAAHYRLLAEIADGVQKKHHNDKAEFFVKKAKEYNEPLSSIFRGCEYVAGVVLPLNESAGLSLVSEGLRTLQLNKLNQVEIDLLTTAMSAMLIGLANAVKKNSLTGIALQMASMKTDIERLWQSLQR